MTRPIRMTALALALVTSGSWAFARSATVGLDPKAAGNSDRPFYAAWLCRRDGGGGNYADVYKGLRVEVLQKGAGSVFYKVRVPYPNSLVVRWDRSWPAVEGDTVGWVNGRFLILSPGETPGQSGSATTPAAGAGGSAGSGAPITILGTESDTGGGGAAAGTASPGPGPGTLPFPPAGGTVPVQGAAQGQLGLEAWRKTLPQLAYIFSPTGDDENYFDALALGRPSDIVDMVRADAAAAQAAAGLTGSYRLVRVKVSSIQEYYTVLRDGLAPPQDRPANRLYTFGELEPVPASILSVAVISHAGCDGPFIPLASGSGYQANYDLVRHDKAAGGANSLFNRLVRGARLRYCGCNTGNDYMWYEVNRRGWAANPSVAHGAAALLAEKQVVAYGKYNSGDVKSRCYVYFSCPPGLNYPVRHVKAKHAYSFGTTKAASTFDDIRIAYATAQERDAYLAWYRSRGITGRAANGVITVSAPRPTWYSRDSQKPALLKALVRAIADDPGATPDVRQPPVQGDDPQTVRRLLPLMDKLAADGRLRRAIDDARRANNGVLDLDDFRIWAVVFMPDHDETAYRADLCDDPNVANVRVQP